MRTYEFTPSEDMFPVFSISVIEEVAGDKVKTRWHDFDGNLNRSNGEQSEKFLKQLANFWRSVCKYENKYRSGMVEKIIESVADPDLKEFLVKNSA